MLAIKLKKSVLNAAVEGKLTKQLQNDSVVAIAVKKVKVDEKYKEKQLSIPNNWKLFRLKDLFDIRNGFTPLRTNKDFWDSPDVPWFTVNDIRNQGRIINYTEQFISYVAATENKIVPKDSVLLCCTASIGEFALTKIDLTTNQQFNGITIKEQFKDYIDIKYVYYWVQTIEDEMKIQAGKTTFPFLSVTKLFNFLIPIPPIEEQKRIIRKLDLLIPLIGKLEKYELELKELEIKFPKQIITSILQFVVEGKLTEQLLSDSSVFNIIDKKDTVDKNHDDIKWEIPDNWEWVRFAKLVNFKIGKTPPRANYEYWGNDYPWVSISDMYGKSSIRETNEYISKLAFEKYFNNKLVPKGTLIMSFKLTIGRVSILDIDAVHNEAIISIFPKKYEEIQKKYLYYVLPHIANMGDTKDAIKGRTLNSKSLSNLLIPVPPIEEQERIIKKLELLITKNQ